ncbi:type IV toxin-antitoxin system AbiEi family antitoxin [Hylemonella sp. W303a]|uniref:type IV toxin-antitoxin system AbiEi family antitoxin n=1 Tax=Hylemonella sp. W303a TaxID=3389873 RepID=UPI00396AF979
MKADPPIPLPERAAQALAALGVPAQCRAAPAGACTLRLGPKGQWTEYRAVAAPALARATLGAALMQARQAAQQTGQPTVLLAEHVTPPLADDLRAQGQPFADAAGNAWLPAPLVLITGRKPLSKPVLPATGRADTPAGLKVLFALLCQPELADATHRAIAAAAGVALGGVPAVLQDLHQQGNLPMLGQRRRLDATRLLLDRWAQTYARRLRPKTLKALYTTPLFDTWAEWGLTPAEGLWGGEPAAGLLTNYLRPGALTLYTPRLPPQFMARQRMSNVTGPVTERVVEWRMPFWGELPPGPRPDIVPPVLVYADLLATGDGRCIETAELLYEQYLAATFP